MNDFASPENFPGADSGFAPCGICSAGWELIWANSQLLHLITQNSHWNSESFKVWLDCGILQQLEYSNSDAPYGQGAFLFRHSSGNTWLLFWHEEKRRIKNKPLRSFILHNISLSSLLHASGQIAGEMENILDFIHDGIWLIDGKGITLRINRAMERIAGIRAEEVVGRHVSEPLREGRFKTCVTLRALQTRQTVTLFDDYSNGKRCLNTSTPIFDEQGNVHRVIAAIRDITELESLQHKLSRLEVEAMAYRLRAEGLESQRNNTLLGHSPQLQRALQDICKAAHADAITLILGETGTGKSLAAKTIHEMGSRAQKPFISINCGAIPASLMESELFGYEKGAFTGASRAGKPGMLELASGGTLLLDEIAELPLALQAKLLHILDGQPIYRVGGTKPLQFNARILAATNKPLDQMVAEGRFREDLFYRLRVLSVEMPPLRERRDDILLLASHFLEKNAEETGRRKILDPSVEQLFLSYAWPGNVRELHGVIQSLVTLCENDRILPDDLPSYMRRKNLDDHIDKTYAPTLMEAVENLEKDMLSKALMECGSTYKAARKLGISQSSVVRKAKKYGLCSHNSDLFTQTLKNSGCSSDENDDLVEH